MVRTATSRRRMEASSARPSAVSPAGVPNSVGDRRRGEARFRRRLQPPLHGLESLPGGGDLGTAEGPGRLAFVPSRGGEQPAAEVGHEGSHRGAGPQSFTKDGHGAAE